MRFSRSSIILLTTLLSGTPVHFLGAQTDIGTAYDAAGIRTVTSSVPFLVIGPEARAGGMADQGVATEADMHAMHWNVAKLGFVDKDMALGVSYSPWLRNLVPDINLAYMAGYKKLNERFTLGASLRYFSLGDISFTTETGTFVGNYNPHELSADVGGAFKLSDKWSVGVAFRFIYSNLTLGQFVGGVATEPGIAGAGDFGFYYQNADKKLFDRNVTWRFGVSVQNIGSKIRFGGTSASDWIPITLRLGGGGTIQIDEYNSIGLYVETSKLLVPTPDYIPAPGAADTAIIRGGDRSQSVLVGMVTSLWDAPFGFREEMDEFVWSVGTEYWYNRVLAVRGGFFYESPQKGNRQYFTLGAGLRYNVFGLDFSYLIPTARNNPLANALRFTLTFNLDAVGKKKKNAE